MMITGLGVQLVRSANLYSDGFVWKIWCQNHIISWLPLNGHLGGYMVRDPVQYTVYPCIPHFQTHSFSNALRYHSAGDLSYILVIYIYVYIYMCVCIYTYILLIYAIFQYPIKPNVLIKPVFSWSTNSILGSPRTQISTENILLVIYISLYIPWYP